MIRSLSITIKHMPQYKYVYKVRKVTPSETHEPNVHQEITYVLFEEVWNEYSKNPTYVSTYYFNDLPEVRKFYRELNDARKKADGKKAAVSIYSEEL